MKITLRVAIFCLYAALAVTACQENGGSKISLFKDADGQELTKEEAEILREQLICRSWKFSKILPSSARDDQRLDVFMPILDAAFENAQFDFGQSGRFTFTLAGETEKGNWKLSRDESRILTTADETGDERVFTVVEVAQDKLILTLGDDEVTLLLTPFAKP
jgi:hypothetical protein